MNKAYLLIAIVITALLTIASGNASPEGTVKDITFISGDNCPYSCPGNKLPGIWVDLIKALLEPEGYLVHHKIRPVKRVHFEVQNITPESNEYRFTIRALTSFESSNTLINTLQSKHPVLFYRGCFILRKGMNWQYQGEESTPAIKLGLTGGLDYSSLSGFLSRPDQEALIQYSVSRTPALTNLKMLVSGRLDAMVSSFTMAQYLAEQEDLLNKIVFSSCSPPQPFHLAFPSRHPLSKELIVTVDRRIKILQSNGSLERIYTRYGISYQELLADQH